MKKSLLVISMMLVLAITVWGCATKGDLDKVQSQEMMTGAKADQAAQDAQAAKAAADAATLKAEASSGKVSEALPECRNANAGSQCYTQHRHADPPGMHPLRRTLSRGPSANRLPQRRRHSLCPLRSSGHQARIFVG